MICLFLSFYFFFIFSAHSDIIHNIILRSMKIRESEKVYKMCKNTLKLLKLFLTFLESVHSSISIPPMLFSMLSFLFFDLLKTFKFFFLISY